MAPAHCIVQSAMAQVIGACVMRPRPMSNGDRPVLLFLEAFCTYSKLLKDFYPIHWGLAYLNDAT